MHENELACLLEEGQESGRVVKVVEMQHILQSALGSQPTMGQPWASVLLQQAAEYPGLHPSGGRGWGIWGCAVGGRTEGAEVPEVTWEADLGRGFPLPVVRQKLCHPVTDALFNLARSL